jgi:signal transduction histidine kinase
LFDNLLENSRKYGRPGGDVIVRTRRDGGVVALAVQDAGLGIDPRDLPHIFEPFFRSARARRDGRPGAGLGLAVASRIAVAFGGTITVHSEEGEGSEFELRLPAIAASPSIPGSSRPRSLLEPESIRAMTR